MTSLNILYSDDGNIFSYVEDCQSKDLCKGVPKVFRGSYDPTTPIEIMLPQPIETRYIRIAPKTWQGPAIALKFDVFTCFSATQQLEEPSEEETFFGGEALFLRPTTPRSVSTPKTTEKTTLTPNELMATLTKLIISLNNLEANVDPKMLAPIKSTIDETKDTTKKVWDDFSKTNYLDPQNMKKLLDLVHALKLISRLQNVLTDPHQIDQVKTTVIELGAIENALVDIRSSEATTIPSIDIAALGAVLTNAHTALGKLETNFDPSLLAPFKDNVGEAKEAMEILKADYSRKGEVNMDKLEDLQKAMSDLRDISKLKPSLGNPLADVQLKEIGNEFDNIGSSLGELLIPLVTTPREDITMTNIGVVALGAVLTKVNTALDKLDTSVDPTDLIAYSEDIENAKKAIDKLKIDYANTGKVNPDNIKILQDAVLDLRDISKLELSLTNPVAIAQVKEAAEEFTDITFSLGDLLTPIPTTTTTERTSVPSIDVAALAAVLGNVNTALEKLDTNVDPISLAPYSENLKGAKNTVDKLKRDFVNTGEVDRENVKELQKTLLDLRNVANLSLSDPTVLAQMKETGEDLTEIGFNLGSLLIPTTTTKIETATQTIDITAVGIVINNLNQALQKIDTSLDPSQLDTYSEDIEVTKKVIKEIKDGYAQTGEVKRRDVEKLQGAMLDLRDISNLEPSLSDPAAIAQVKETAGNLMEISFNLGEILTPIATTPKPDTTTTELNLIVLNAVLADADTALDKLDTNLDSEDLAPFSENIEKAQKTLDILKDDYIQTGEVDLEQLKNLQNYMLNLQDIVNLEPSLTNPLSLAQAKETADDFLDINFSLGALLGPLTTTTTTTKATPSSDVDIKSLGPILTAVDTLLQDIEQKLSEEEIAAFADGLNEVKDAVNHLKLEFSSTGHFDANQVKQLHDTIKELQSISDLKNTLTDPQKIKYIKSTENELKDISQQLSQIILPLLQIYLPTSQSKYFITSTMVPVSLEREKLTAILSKVHNTLGELESNVNTKDLLPFKEDFNKAKKATQEIWKDYSNTGAINVNKLIELHSVVVDILDISALHKSLTGQASKAQVMKSSEDLRDIKKALSDILTITTETPEEHISNPSIEVAAVSQVFSKVNAALDKIDTSVDPSSLVPYSEDIKEAKDTMDKLKEEYAKTGEINVDGLKELQHTMLDLRDVSNLEPSLTDPSAIAQVKEAGDEFLDISFNLGALLSPVATTTPRVETTTARLDLAVVDLDIASPFFETTSAPLPRTGNGNTIEVFPGLEIDDIFGQTDKEVFSLSSKCFLFVKHHTILHGTGG